MLTIKGRAGKEITLLLAAVTLFAGCSPPGARALLQGKKLLEQGRYPLAVEQLKMATVLLGNTNAPAFNYLGLACHQAGQFAEAERAYRRALALNPDLAEARYNLGCLLVSENKFDQAKAELTAFTLQRGNAIDGWIQLASAQLRSREFNAAERSFGEVLRFSPQNPEALTGMGVIRLEHNHSAREAGECFSRALKAQPNYGPALLDLAIVAQEHLKDRPLALRTYREYLNLKPVPENAPAVQAIVRQLEQELAPPRPVAAVASAETRPPPPTPKPASTETVRTSTPAKSFLAEVPRSIPPPKSEPSNNSARTGPVLNLSKSPASAPAAVQPAYQVEKVPSEPTLRPAEDVASPPAAPPRAPVQALNEPSMPTERAPAGRAPKRGFFQRINPINLFSGGSKAPPAAPPPLSEPAALARETEVSDNAAAGEAPRSSEAGNVARYKYRAFAPLEAGNRAQAETFFAQGIREQQARHLTDAIRAYSRAVEVDQSFFDAQYNLGLAAFQAGSLPLALSAYENALAVVPESEEARYNFALALKQANYTADAANELEKVVARYPNDSPAHLALGNLYAQQLNQPAKARLHYRKLLEIDPRNPQAAAVQSWLMAHSRNLQPQNQ